jgi:hypothetical protein
MSDATSAAIAWVVDRLLAGELDLAHAADELYRLSPTGLAGDVRALTPDQRTRFAEVAPALRWEIAKKVGGAKLPNVAYGSPVYHAFMASIPRGVGD